jgi:hypothetical protein
MRKRLGIAAGMLAWGGLTTGVAQASPPAATVEVAPGKDTIVKLFDVQVLAMDRPEVASAEALAGGLELLITGRAQGVATAVALTSNGIQAIQLRVRAPGTTLELQDEPAWKAAEAACPGLKRTGEGDSAHLEVTVATPACRLALKAALAPGRYRVKQVELMYGPEALEAQVGELEAALARDGVPVKPHYQGMTLVLAGTVTHAQAERLVLDVYGSSLGGVPLDLDKLEIQPVPEPDAGPPAPEKLPVVEKLPVTETLPPEPGHPRPPGAKKPPPSKGKP